MIPYTVLLIRAGGRVLMRQRTETLLNGLWCFPMLEGTFSDDTLMQHVRRMLQLSCTDLRAVGPARHVFTHRIWQMQLYTMSAEASASAPAGYEFIALDQLASLPVPVAMNAAVSVLRQGSPE